MLEFISVKNVFVLEERLNDPTWFTNCSGPIDGTFRICPAGLSDVIVAYDRILETLVLCQIELGEMVEAEGRCLPVVGSSNGNKTITVSYLDKNLDFTIQNELNAF